MNDLQKDPRLKTSTEYVFWHILWAHFIVDAADFIVDAAAVCQNARKSILTRFFVTSRLFSTPTFLLILSKANLLVNQKSPLLRVLSSCHNEIVITIAYQSPSSHFVVYNFQRGDCDCLLVHHVDGYAGRSSILGVETKHDWSEARPHSFSMSSVCKLVQDWTLSGPLNEKRYERTFEDNNKKDMIIPSSNHRSSRGLLYTHTESFRRLAPIFINTLWFITIYNPVCITIIFLKLLVLDLSLTKSSYSSFVPCSTTTSPLKRMDEDSTIERPNLVQQVVDQLALDLSGLMSVMPSFTFMRNTWNPACRRGSDEDNNAHSIL